MRKTAPKNAFHRRRGSIVVEFLLVMPAFLVLSMFVLEVGLTWADRHVARLAAFEAARVLASANLPEWGPSGVATTPCDAPAAMRRARQAALRKMAIIAPPLPLYIAKLGKAAQGIDFGQITGTFDGALARLAKRWPTAVASTQVRCDYDNYLRQVSVTLTYDRMLQTPVIDRVMFLVYQLSKINAASPVKLSLDEHFMAIRAGQLSPLAMLQTRAALGDSLQQVKNMQMSLGDAADFLRDVPGIDNLFSNIPSAPADISGALGNAVANATTDLSMTDGLQSTLDQQAAVLTSLVTKIPEALWRIPMTVDVALQRDAYSSAVKPGVSVGEDPWQGLISGVLNLKDGAFRTWARAMSDRQAHETDLRPESVPVSE